MKKVLILCLALALAIGTAITGTVAYLQETDSDVNVAVVGNVEIEQLEMQRKEGVAHKGTLNKGDLVEYVQKQPLYPAYPVVGAENPYTAEGSDLLKWGPYVTVSNTAANGMWSDEKLKGAMDKIIFVENTGTAPCYYRTWLAFECPDGMTYGEGPSAEFMMNVNGSTTRFDWEDVGYVDIDGTRYFVTCANYMVPLEAGKISQPSLLQVVMTDHVNNDQVELLNGTYEILAFTQAVQTANFEDVDLTTIEVKGIDGEAVATNAELALVTAFGTGHPWVKDENGNVAGFENAPAALADTATELVEALENGKDIMLTDDIKVEPADMSNAYGTTGINVKNGQTIDGLGNTLDVKGANGTWDSAINTTGGLIKDITVTGAFRGIFINHNSEHAERVVLDNVTIKGTTYTISCDQGKNQGLTATNSRFYGWTSYAKTLGDAKFVNCYFGKDGYAYCRPYAPTEFVGCNFEAGYTVDPRADITFEDCTLDGKPLTDANLATLVTDTSKATVK